MNKQDIESLCSQLKQWGNFDSGILFLIKMICKMNNWPYGEIWRPDIKDEFMSWSGYWSKNETFFERFSKFSSIHKFARGQGLIGRCWKEKKLLCTEDISKTKDFLRSDIASSCGLNAVITFPIINENEVLLLLCFFLNKLAANDQEKADLIFRYSEIIGKILVNLRSQQTS